FSANSQCVSKPFDDSTTSIICANGSSKLWEINSRTLNIRLLKDYKVEAFDETIIENVYSKANSDTLYLNTYSYSIDENYNKTGEKWSLLSAYNLKTNEEISLPGIRNENTVFQYGQSLIYQEHNSIQILNFTSKKSKKIKLPKNFKLQTTTTSNENIYLALEDRSAMDSSIVFVLNKNTLQKEIELKLPYGAVFFNDKYGIGYEDDDQLYTNYPIRNRSIAWKNDKSLFTQDDDISYTTDGLLLYKNEWLLNLATLEIEGQFPSFYSSVLFSQLGKNMLLQIEKNAHIEGEEKPHYTINIYDIASKKIVWKSEKQALQSIYSGPNKIVLSPGEKYALVYENSLFGDATYGLLLNMDTKEITELKNKYEFNIIAFSKDEKLLTLSSKEKAIQIITATGEKQKAQAPTNSDTRVQFEGQFVELITNGKSTRYYARQYLRAVNYLPDSKLIVAGSESGNLLFWTLDKKSPEKIIEIGSAPVLTIYRNGNKLFVLMRNSEIKIIDLRSLSLDATISFFEKDDDVSLVWYTPQGFFKADKRDIRNFHFVKGLVPYPLINYEVLLNRPDTLMAQLGYTEEALQRIYKDAYLKRLKRNGIPSSQDFLTQDRPQIHLINEDKILPLVDNSQVFLKVRLSAKDNTKTLLKTYINGVKINEKPMTDEQVYTIPITLSQGENIVSIIANDNGIESDPISLEIYNNTPPVELRVHYIGIGVSDYQDSSMNLQYADKDVRTMATFLKGKYSEKIRIDTLTNKAATRENILSLKAVLKSTRVDDIVIVAFSGHGLLDTQQNFYFATHDVIFADPEVNGISYDDLVSLLDDIPARKKLLLIDACHSGEIDSEEDLKITEFTNSHVSESTPKGVLIGEADGSQGGLNTSFDLMKSLFYDTDRGNGSFVISAAGGKEFAYEDEKWGNGVFTYSIINAMSELSYDVWRGTQGIKISQLKIEVYKQVEDLTNGRQKPTSRAENVEWDWEL
ncbi:MAG: putative O-methyltransferase YrrM, partial [Bacteroidia bacterium]